MGLAIYHSLLLYFGIYFILKGGEWCYIVIIFDSSLNHTHPLTEVPFETGKVVGLWYVGNTVYTVSMLFYTMWTKVHVASKKLILLLSLECGGDCQH